VVAVSSAQRRLRRLYCPVDDLTGLREIARIARAFLIRLHIGDPLADPIALRLGDSRGW
jgi:hypothetical protein